MLSIEVMPVGITLTERATNSQKVKVEHEASNSSDADLTKQFYKFVKVYISPLFLDDLDGEG